MNRPLNITALSVALLLAGSSAALADDAEKGASQWRIAMNANDTLDNARHVLSPAKLRHVCDFIRSHLADELDLSILADIARLSRYHFVRVFTRTIGLSPYAYVVACRIEMAIHLLHDPDLSLTKIAALTGFNSVAQLSAMFRRQTGLSSSKYRNDLLKKSGTEGGDRRFEPVHGSALRAPSAVQITSAISAAGPDNPALAGPRQCHDGLGYHADQHGQHGLA